MHIAKKVLIKTDELLSELEAAKMELHPHDNAYWERVKLQIMMCNTIADSWRKHINRMKNKRIYRGVRSIFDGTNKYYKPKNKTKAYNLKRK